ncbi:hypothetical protein [Pendulispora brunnea]
MSETNEDVVACDAPTLKVLDMEALAEAAERLLQDEEGASK